MADIFLSYNRDDKATARRFAQAFETAGLSVWWDVTLRSGDAYDEVTEDALKTAKAVVVLWSKTSVNSRWVRAEATIADEQGTLVPAKIEACDLPVMFRLTQTADLSHWRGNDRDQVWRTFLGDVERLVGKGAKPGGFEQPEAHTTAPRTQGLSIAVLPFANMSGDPEQEYFADGIAEEILNALTRITQLQVRGRTSSFYFKGRNEDLKSIATQLNVDHLLEGSVRKSGDKVRITVQLIHVPTDVHLWSKRYDRVLDDIFAIQEDIAASVASTLEISLGIGELGSEPGMTHDVRAYELFLEARKQNSYMDLDHFQRTVELLEQAVKIDPQFAIAWAALAITYMGFARFHTNSQVNLYWDRAKSAFGRAQELAPDSPGVLVFKAEELQSQRRWQETGEVVQRLATLQSKPLAAGQSLYTTALSPGFFACSTGHISAALDYFQAAAREEPLDQLPVTVSGTLLTIQGDFAAAQAAYEKAKSLPIGNLTIVYNAEIAFAMARRDRATLERALQKFLEHALHSLYSIPGKAAGEFVSAMAPLLDSPRAALEALHRFIENPDFKSPMLRTNLMTHWAAYLGDPQLALELQYIDGKPAVLHPATLWLPNLAEMRRLPGFKQLLIDIGLVDYWRATGKWGDFCKPVGDDDFECH